MVSLKRAKFFLIFVRPREYVHFSFSVVATMLTGVIQSWCQVAAECMPAGSLIVGVDLAPIKPIPRVISFQSDITTDKCRSTLRSHVKHLKADTVLHDGAPNVGTAWVQDAFTQAELVLQSMKLATEFLREGGTFVTKVFRSKDYNPLLWVFKQLFTSVEATKPPSSRNVSAEIFVVCRGYKAPKRLDPKFLDPRHVFAELADPTPNNEAKVFEPEKKKRKREGYEEGDYTQHKEISVTEFINTTDPIAILGTYHTLSFQQSPTGDLALATLERLDETTDEIRKCCEDLRVLGKKEFRSLLKWRLKVREKFGLVVKKKKTQEEGEEVAEVAPMDEELAIQEELQRLRDNENSQRKKERRKENERKRKEIVRMQMHMITPTDIGMEQDGIDGARTMFAMKAVNRLNAADKIAAGKMVELESEEESEASSGEEETDDEEDQLERELDSLYESYQEQKQDRDSKLRAKKARKDYEAEEWEGFSGSDKEEASDDEDDDISLSSTKLPQSGSLSKQASLFFDQDVFEGLEDIDELDDENDSAIDMADRPARQSAKEAATKSKAEPSTTEDQEEDGWGSSDEEVEKPDDPRTKDGRLGLSNAAIVVQK
jgi:AdoMet-dependent rRNA methyltransferase SPB1